MMPIYSSILCNLCKGRKLVLLGSVPSVKKHSLGTVRLSLASLRLPRLGLQCVKKLCNGLSPSEIILKPFNKEAMSEIVDRN